MKVDDGHTANPFSLPLSFSSPSSPNDIYAVNVNVDMKVDDDATTDRSDGPCPPCKCGDDPSDERYANPHGRGDSWSDGHPRKEEFERYLSDGIPRGMSITVLIRSDYVKYVCHRFNSAPLAEKAIMGTLGVGCDAGVTRERIARLKSRLRFIGFKPSVRRQERTWRETVLTTEENAWLDELKAYLDRNRRKYPERTRADYLRMAEFILKKCRTHPRGARIGPTDLVREFGWNGETCKKRFRVFKTGIPIIRETEPSVAKVKRTTYVRVDVLPCLDEGFKLEKPRRQRRFSLEDWQCLIGEMKAVGSWATD